MASATYPYIYSSAVVRESASNRFTNCHTHYFFHFGSEAQNIPVFRLEKVVWAQNAYHSHPVIHIGVPHPVRACVRACVRVFKYTCTYIIVTSYLIKSLLTTVVLLLSGVDCHCLAMLRIKPFTLVYILFYIYKTNLHVYKRVCLYTK